MVDGNLCTTKSDPRFFILKFRPVMLIYDPSEGPIITKNPVARGGLEKANLVTMVITSGAGVQKTLNFILTEKIQTRNENPDFSFAFLAFRGLKSARDLAPT